MSSIAQFSATVFATDTAAVRDVYVDLFDLEVVTDLGWFVSLRRGEAPWELCIWDPGHETVPAGVGTTSGTTPGTTSGSTPGTTAGVVLAFVVDDVDALAEAARRRGIEALGPPVDEPWGQRHVFLRDPVGTIIDVVQITAPDPAWLAANGIDPEIVPAPG